MGRMPRRERVGGATRTGARDPARHGHRADRIVPACVEDGKRADGPMDMLRPSHEAPKPPSASWSDCEPGAAPCRFCRESGFDAGPTVSGRSAVRRLYDCLCPPGAACLVCLFNRRVLFRRVARPTGICREDGERSAFHPANPGDRPHGWDRRPLLGIGNERCRSVLASGVFAAGFLIPLIVYNSTWNTTSVDLNTSGLLSYDGVSTSVQTRLFIGVVVLISMLDYVPVRPYVVGASILGGLGVLATPAWVKLTGVAMMARRYRMAEGVRASRS